MSDRIPEDLERMPIPPHPFDGGGVTDHLDGHLIHMHGPRVYGLEIPSTHRPERSCIGSIETSGAGNVVLRIGRETAQHAPSWQQTEHVVLSPDEARALIADIAGRLQPDRISIDVDGAGFTTEGWALWLEGWCDHPNGESDGPACCIWRQAAAAMRSKGQRVAAAEALLREVLGEEDHAKVYLLVERVAAFLASVEP